MEGVSGHIGQNARFYTSPHATAQREPASSGVTGLNNSEKTLNRVAATVCVIALPRALSASRCALVTTKTCLLASVEMKPRVVRASSRTVNSHGRERRGGGRSTHTCP